MSSTTKNLHNLLNLAQEHSSEGRRDLLREVTDLFLKAPADLSDVEVELFGGVINDLVHDMEVEVRAGLAKRLSLSSVAPKSVITMLANDEIEVARPILENSLVLNSETLIRIVKQRNQEHNLAISLRGEIDEATTEALLEQGDDAVLEAVARNPGAELSKKSMRFLVEKSEHNEKLHRPLVSRQDLPPDLQHQMFWWVSNVLRERILSMTENMDRETLDSIIAETEQELSSEPQINRVDYSPAQKFIQRKKSLGQLNEALLMELLRAGQVPEFIVGFALLAKLDVDTSRRIVLDLGCEPLAIACKACEFDRSTFSTLEMLTYRGPVRPTHEVVGLLEIYDRVSVESAKRAIRFWRIRVKASGGEAYWPPRGTNYAQTEFLDAPVPDV